MDKFLVRKKNAKNSECEAQHVVSQNTKRQKVQTYDEEFIKLGFIECPSDFNAEDILSCYERIVSEILFVANSFL